MSSSRWSTGAYAILDVDAFRARGVDVSQPGVVESIAAAMLEGGASMLQLRAKEESGRATLSLLRRLSPCTRAANVPLVCNDRVDLALLADADAVHVGQDDLPLADARAIAPRLSIGVSTHSLEQLRAALDGAPSYVAFGPVFGTTSKKRADATVGVSLLGEAARLAAHARVPLVAIGGVTVERAPQLVEVGVRWAAVISELVVVDHENRPDLSAIARRTRALSDALSTAVRV